MFRIEVPEEVEELLNKLEANGYSSYIIGHGLAELFLGRKPQMWQIATSASSQGINEIFPQTFFTATKENYLTIVIWQRPIEVFSLGSISLREHLSQYAFSIETLAYDWKNKKILDLFSTHKAITKKSIEPLIPAKKLFYQHPLEMLRAIRLAAQYQFFLSNVTMEQISKHHKLLEHIALNKIRDELALILLVPRPSIYLNFLAQTSIINLFIPELEEALNYQINDNHNLGKHLFLTVDYLPIDLELRLAGLFHDLGKISFKPLEYKKEAIFPRHENISAQMGKKILDRLNFFTKVVGYSINHHKILSLIKNHMFSYNPLTTSDKGIERLIARIGIENIDGLLALRKANILAGSQAKQSNISFYRSLENHLKRILKGS